MTEEGRLQAGAVGNWGGTVGCKKLARLVAEDGWLGAERGGVSAEGLSQLLSVPDILCSSGCLVAGECGAEGGGGCRQARGLTEEGWAVGCRCG